MYEGIEVAKFVISFCAESETPVSNLQLQKILYFLQVYFIKMERYLFQEDFYAWQYGPVIPEIYFMFAGYGASKINSRYNTFLEKEDKDIIEPLIQKLIEYSSWELVAMTHREGGPWDRVLKNGGENSIIPKEYLLYDEAEF
ncbi:MAG: DUF4065 domain-containing protein [Roseburia sp.]|nr:DUF4065 domain-containing protein [Roseburia sp.]MCM1430251.1 DUF4065 domain-containing protein [Muribaculaceae bacterium]